MESSLLSLDVVPWLVAAVLLVRLVFARLRVDQLSAQLAAANDRLAWALSSQRQAAALDDEAQAAVDRALQAMAARVARQRAENEEEVALR